MTLSANTPDFWIAAAAAAPVIALAGLVAISDTAVTADIVMRSREYQKCHPELIENEAKGVEKIGPPWRWVLAYNVLNLLIQGFVLIVALLALLQDGTPIPGTLIIALEGVGILLLLAGAWLAGQIGAEKQRWEEALRPEQQAKAIASKLLQVQLASSPPATTAAHGSPENPEETGRA